MVILEKINNSNICFLKNPPIHIGEYYNYCLFLLKDYIRNRKDNINIIFGPINHDSHDYIKIDIQCEHTLVKEGGRSINKIIYGNIKHDNGNYLVRIDNYEYFNSLDYIIEYSLPNIENIRTSNLFNDYLEKIIYVSPTIYDLNFNKNNRNRIITLMNKNSSQRRFELINKLENLNLNYQNHENIFDKQDILTLYSDTKILINIHQTNHHHTFEELRVLPALQNGIIIIAENSPLKEMIPYRDYILWADYENIPSKVLEVNDNYDYYFQKFFIDNNLKQILENMTNNNKIRI